MNDHGDPFLIRFAMPLPREVEGTLTAADIDANGRVSSERERGNHSTEQTVTRSTAVRRETTDDS
jgi:hypothetical protein